MLPIPGEMQGEELKTYVEQVQYKFLRRVCAAPWTNSRPAEGIEQLMYVGRIVIS